MTKGSFAVSRWSPEGDKNRMKEKLAGCDAWRPYVLAGCVIFLVFGCGRSELTRSAARDLISHSAKFSPKTPTLKLSSAELQCGQKEGWWAEAPRRKPSLDLFAFHLQVTPKGKTTFGELSSSYSSGYAAQVTLNKEYTRTATEITGISDFTPPLEGWTWQGSEIHLAMEPSSCDGNPLSESASPTGWHRCVPALR
jgi:hypothetical protein